ncbi:MAG TPA: hypothetical protein VIM96_01710 [Pseudomonadales bacterium]
MKNDAALTRGQVALWNSAAFLLLLAFTHYTAQFLYPGVYYPAAGVQRLLLITAITGMVIGPVLVAYLWVPGKKGLWLDMTVMALLQVTLWTACLWALYTQRPVWLVFAIDRFVVLRANEIDSNQLPESIPAHPKPGHPQLVFASQPDDKVLKEKIMFEASGGGADIERYPALWSLPTATSLQSIHDAQSASIAYYGNDVAIHDELLLIGSKNDLLVYWDAQLQRITRWRHEPSPAFPVPDDKITP